MLKLYNSLTKKEETFKPLKNKTVTMYNCGPTVYDYAHIGNLRAFTFADVLRRYLEHKGYTVKQVMNFTDVGHMFGDVDIGEDRMAAAAEREKKDPWSIAQFYIEAFLGDAEKMNLEEPTARPRATDHIKDMIELIQKLIDKGYAYVVNGSVYFDVEKFMKYGQLSGNTTKKLKMGAGGRAEFNPDKRNQFDFALWINDPKHAMNWKSPWCERGYPGWHIECSTMVIKHLGETIDIHTGGVDNIFPHHENEIAQSEAATDKRFVNYWLHNEHLLVDGQRMGKSLGNYYTLKDIIAKDYDPKVLRYLLLSTHYRQQLNFTLEGLESAKNAVDRLRNFTYRLTEANGKRYGEYAELTMKKAEEGFEEAMDDDLNTSVALAGLFDFIKDVNKLMDEDRLSDEEARKIYELMMRFDKVLGVIGEIRKEERLPEEAEELIRKREEARKAKDWKTADKLREQLRAMGITIEDTAEGVRWRIKKR
jgi:cysteinyl-tRNA synthetase